MSSAIAPASTRLKAIVALLAIALAATMTALGWGAGAEQTLASLRNALRHHAASGDVVLVEVDARSLARYSAWPWPRGLYARAITAADRAGAQMMAFDIDFSAHAQPHDDAQFAAAIERAHMPVVLPTFVQPAAQGDRGTVENLPLPELRRHAMLASVNIGTDSDGMVRQSPVTVATQGVPRPSISAMLAGRTVRNLTSFPIDTAIALDSLPRISFGDLVEGHVPRAQLAGKTLLVGATAIELGDRYAVPGYGVIPGALVQVLAAETLREGSAPVPLPGWIALAALGLVIFARTRMAMLRTTWGLGIVACAVAAVPFALEALHCGTVAIVPVLGALCLLAGGDTLRRMVERTRAARSIDAETGLGNALALRKTIEAAPRGTVVVLRMANYSDLARMIGPEHGDELWQALLRRLGAVTDQPVFRVAPDSLAWLDPAGSPALLADHLDSASLLISQPLRVDGRAVRLVAGFGMTVATFAPARALDQAIAAAVRATRTGTRCVTYADEDYLEGEVRLALAGELEAALTNGQISVVYQPKLDIARNTIVGCEALLRWNHPARGWISPELVVELAEEHECIARLTRFVFETAIAAHDEWARAGHALGVAINLSPVLVRDASFLRGLGEMLIRIGATPGTFTFEVTESADLVLNDDSTAGLDALVAIGGRLSIDDYGTGQSTLSYLKRLPATELKIDKSFVLNLVHDSKDRLMVRSTIALAHDLGYRVVAEGVETAEILAELQDAGCDVAQGWLIGRPMARSALLDLLNDRARANAAQAFG